MPTVRRANEKYYFQPLRVVFGSAAYHLSRIYLFVAPPGSARAGRNVTHSRKTAHIKHHRERAGRRFCVSAAKTRVVFNSKTRRRRRVFASLPCRLYGTPPRAARTRRSVTHAPHTHTYTDGRTRARAHTRRRRVHERPATQTTHPQMAAATGLSRRTAANGLGSQTRAPVLPPPPTGNVRAGCNVTVGSAVGVTAAQLAPATVFSPVSFRRRRRRVR